MSPSLNDLKSPSVSRPAFPHLTPLIDVMFLLLVFFLLTTTFERSGLSKNVPVELPHAERTQMITTDQALVLSIDEDGDFMVDGKRCAVPELVERLEFRNPADSVVVISGHKKAPYQSVIRLYDVMQGLGIKRFTHQVR